MNDMTQIKHHLTDQLMMGYAAGALPEAFNLVVATHLSMCDSCRAAAQAYDAIGGAILETDTRVSVADDALAETLALIAQGQVCQNLLLTAMYQLP